MRKVEMSLHLFAVTLAIVLLFLALSAKPAQANCTDINCSGGADLQHYLVGLYKRSL
jgi:hypothetical protein